MAAALAACGQSQPRGGCEVRTAPPWAARCHSQLGRLRAHVRGGGRDEPSILARPSCVHIGTPRPICSGCLGCGSSRSRCLPGARPLCDEFLVDPGKGTKVNCLAWNPSRVDPEMLVVGSNSTDASQPVGQRTTSKISVRDKTRSRLPAPARPLRLSSADKNTWRHAGLVL